MRRAVGYSWWDLCEHHSGPWNTRRCTSVMMGSNATSVRRATVSATSILRAG